MTPKTDVWIKNKKYRIYAFNYYKNSGFIIDDDKNQNLPHVVQKMVTGHPLAMKLP